MKRILQISTLSLVLLSCGAINRNLFGATESDLIKTVAIDQGCPAENIKILESQKELTEQPIHWTFVERK